MAIIPKFFIDAVVSIGTRDSQNNINWNATGFFLTRKTEQFGKVRPFLITNRHVFANLTHIVIRMKEKESDNLKEVDAPIIDEKGNPLFVLHPNINIDIAVLPLNGSFIEENNLHFPAFDIDEHCLTSKTLIDYGIEAGSLVYMLGFPMGLVTRESNLPICRLGCIGRICEAQIQETNNILLDIQNFPGNSGSPIILRPEIMAIDGTKFFDKSVMIGIIHSYIPYQERLVNLQTQQIVEVRTENSGIANMHPVEYILEIIDNIQPKAFLPEMK